MRVASWEFTGINRIEGIKGIHYYPILFIPVNPSFGKFINHKRGLICKRRLIIACKLDTITSGFDGKYCWVQARAGAIPGDPPVVVMTMQRLLLTGSDVFYGPQ